MRSLAPAAESAKMSNHTSGLPNLTEAAAPPQPKTTSWSQISIIRIILYHNGVCIGASVYTPILQNQTERKMENEIETAIGSRVKDSGI